MKKQRFISATLVVFLFIQSLNTFSVYNLVQSKVLDKELQNDIVSAEIVDSLETSYMPENKEDVNSANLSEIADNGEPDVTPTPEKVQYDTPIVTPDISIKNTGSDFGEKSGIDTSIDASQIILTEETTPIQSTIPEFSQTSEIFTTPNPISDVSLLKEDEHDDGLIAWYKFDGNTSDFINNYESTVIGKVNYTEGILGKAVELDGMSYISFGDLEMNSSNRTISLWVAPYNDNNTNNILSKYSDNSDIEVLFRTQNDRSYFTEITVGENYVDLSKEASKGTEFIGKFDLITETYDGEELRLYVNGELKISRKISGQISNNTYPLILGTNSDNPGSEGYFKGCIDDLRIYNRALSEEDVMELYNEAKRYIPSDSISPDAPKELRIESKITGANNISTVNLNWEEADDNIGVTGYILYRNGVKIADIRETNYTDNNLLAGEYNYTVKAYDASYNLSEESNEVYCDNLPPSIPSNLSIQFKTFSSVKLVWDESTDNVGVKGYSVYRNGEFVGTTKDNYFDDVNLQAGLYTYQVKAFDDFDNASELSDSVVFNNVPLTAPDNLVVSSKTDTSVTLKWSAPGDNEAVSGYKVFCNEIEIASVNDTNYTHYIKNDENYSFYVVAFDKDGNESDKSNVLVLENEPPEKPANLKVSLSTYDSAILSWSEAKDNVGVIKYLIFVNSNLVGETDKTTYTVTNLIPGRSYILSVKAVDASANISDESFVNIETSIPPVYLDSDLILNENKVYGDLYIQGGTIDLNGYNIKVEGNLIHTGGTLYINGGQLHVKGDYKIENNRNHTWAYLKMVNEADYVKVEGSFSTRSFGDHVEYLTAGTIEVKGDFIQKAYSSSYPNNFRAGGTHKVILSGESIQRISFDTPGQSYFNIFEVRNNYRNIILNSQLATRKIIINSIDITTLPFITINWELLEDVTIKNDLYITSGVVDLSRYRLNVEGSLIQTGGTLNLNRCQMYIEGNLIQSGGTMNINAGQLYVKGDYRI